MLGQGQPSYEAGSCGWEGLLTRFEEGAMGEEERTRSEGARTCNRMEEGREEGGESGLMKCGAVQSSHRWGSDKEEESPDDRVLVAKAGRHERHSHGAGPMTPKTKGREVGGASVAQKGKRWLLVFLGRGGFPLW